jgi:hypothetical protein
MTANSGAAHVLTPGGVKQATILLKSSASLVGKFEVYKRFSGDDRLLVSIKPNRPSRPEQSDSVSIVASDPDGRRLLSVEKYDLRQLTETGVVFDTIVKDPAVYTVSVSMTVDVTSSTATHTNDRSITVSADLEPVLQLPKQNLQ